MEEVAEIIDRLLALDPFTRGAVESLLAVRLQLDEESQRCGFYKGECATGPFVESTTVSRSRARHRRSAC